MRELAARARALAKLRGPAELLLFTRLLVVAAAAPRLMRLPLPRAAALLTPRPGTLGIRPEEVDRLVELAALAPRVAHPLVRPGCLTRGLTLFWFLRRRGVDVELRFGLEVDGPDGADGHCWLALDDTPYLEPTDPRARFSEILRLPPAAG